MKLYTTQQIWMLVKALTSGSSFSAYCFKPVLCYLMPTVVLLKEVSLHIKLIMAR